MPPQPQWLLRVPRILEEIRHFPAPVLDRASIEKLFGVKRWQAIQLLHRFGGYQAGKTFLVDRQALVQQLEAIQAGDEFSYQQKRRQRVVDELNKARKYLKAAAVKISVREGASFEMEGLPAGVRLEGDQLLIQFESVPDLLSKLYELGQTIANDFERFKQAVEHGKRGGKT